MIPSNNQTSERQNQLDRDRLQELAIEAKKTGVVSDELALLFYEVAREVRMSRKIGPYKTQDIEDVTQDAVMKCCTAVKGFNVKRGSAHSLFYTTILNTYRRSFTLEWQKMGSDQLSLDAIFEQGTGTAKDRKKGETQPSSCLRKDFMSSPETKRKFLTEAQQDEIELLCSYGLTQVAVADMFGVHRYTVYRILKRRKQ